MNGLVSCDVTEPGSAVLERCAGAVGGEADGVIPPAEHEQVEQLRLAELRGQAVPQPVVDVGASVQGIYCLDEQPIPAACPAGVRGIAVGERSDLVAREVRPFGKERHVDPPLVLAAAAGVVRSITISRSRRVSDSLLLSSYPPQPSIAAAIGMFLTKVLKSRMGGTPDGIMADSRASTSGS